MRSNRLLAADLFDGLTDPQWQAPSLCTGWTVRDVAGHMLTLHEVSVPASALRIRPRAWLDRSGDGLGGRSVSTSTPRRTIGGRFWTTWSPPPPGAVSSRGDAFTD